MAVRGGGSADKPGRQLIYDPLAKSWEGMCVMPPSEFCAFYKFRIFFFFLLFLKRTKMHSDGIPHVLQRIEEMGGGGMAKVGLNFSFVVITDGNLT